MSDILPGMNEKYGSPRRMPYTSESDSMLYTGEYHNIPPPRPQTSQSGTLIENPFSRSAVKVEITYFRDNSGYIIYNIKADKHYIVVLIVS